MLPLHLHKPIQSAVVLSNDVILTTTDSNITFSSTIDSDGTSRDLTLTLGNGSASITGIVGTTSLADITLNSSATFNAAITATNLTIAANKTATVKDDVTIASTIALSGSSTLEVINTSAMTIAGTITDTGTGNSITVNDNDANTAPNIVTFSGTVAADTLYIGTATTAGHAKFTGTTGPTITSITITGGNHANEDSTATFNYALTSTSITLDDNTGDAYLIFAENNSVTIAGTIDGAANGEGNLVVSGQIKTFSGNVGSTNPLNFIVQASAVFNGTLNASSTTIEADFLAPSLVISGDITINANITTVGIQTYAGNVIIGSNVNLTTTNNKITFNGTVNSQSSEANTLTIDVGSSEVEFNGIVGGAVNGGLGAIDITGALNLDAAITSAASLTVSTTTNLAANVTTAGTQTYGDGISSGAVVLSTDVTLTTTDSNITFNGTVRSDSSDTPRDLTINLDANSNGTTADLIINGIVGGNSLPLDVISITGDLDLNSSIGNSPGATSITVSGDANLGADVETTGTQTYSGAVTFSTDVTLTTTDSNITFGSTVDGDGTARDLTIDMDNSGVGADGTVQFANTVGANNSLDVIDITGNLNLDAAINNTTSLSVSGTSNLGANVTTSSTQTYSDAVTLSTDVTLTTTDSNITFSSTIDSDGTARDLTLTLGSGSASITGIVGTTALDVLTLNSSASFTAAVTATNLTIAANKTATFSDDLTAAVTNSGGLLFNHTGSGATVDITYTAGGADIIRVEDSQDNVSPAVVTFSNAITATALRVGALDGSKGGNALFAEAVTIPTITVIGGNHADEDSTLPLIKQLPVHQVLP